MLNVTKLKEIMKEKGIETMRELSDKSNIPYTTLYYIMKGHDMNVTTLKLLADFLKEPLDSLIEDECNYVLYIDDGDKVYCKHIKASSNYEVMTKYMM